MNNVGESYSVVVYALICQIDGLMDIICRKLYFDPNNPAVLYNEEKLLTLLAKLDKQMGP